MDEAALFGGVIVGNGPVSKDCSQINCPEAASKQYMLKRFDSAMAVIKRRPLATTGDDIPSPSLTDHRTFFSCENSTGNGSFEEETPLQLGPRNCGQSSEKSGELPRIEQVNISSPWKTSEPRIFCFIFGFQMMVKGRDVFDDTIACTSRGRNGPDIRSSDKKVWAVLSRLPVQSFVQGSGDGLKGNRR